MCGMTDLPTLKDCVKGSVWFICYRAGNLWYRCDNGFQFPVPISDTGVATFSASEKGIFMMRYIRKHLDSVEGAES